MPPRLPAVIPGAGFDEVARPADGFGRVEEVGGRGEELVREGEDAGGQERGDEVWGSSAIVFLTWMVCVCRGSSTNAGSAEGAVYLVRRDEIRGGGLDVLNRFGGECMDLHSLND